MRKRLLGAMSAKQWNKILSVSEMAPMTASKTVLRNSVAVLQTLSWLIWAESLSEDSCRLRPNSRCSEFEKQSNRN